MTNGTRASAANVTVTKSVNVPPKVPRIIHKIKPIDDSVFDDVVRIKAGIEAKRAEHVYHPFLTHISTIYNVNMCLTNISKLH